MSEKKSIIELLGIKPIDPYIANDLIESHKSEYVCIEDEAREVEKQRNELLKALIKLSSDLDKTMVSPSFENTQWGKYLLPPIEAACHPLKWSEIKELLNG